MIHAAIMTLKNRFFAVLIACCTDAMNWFASGHRFLQAVGENSRSSVVKFIALLFCLPCFKLSHAFFKIAYRINQLRLRRLWARIFSWSSMIAALRRVASSISFSPFARSKAAFRELIPSNTSATMFVSPTQECVSLLLKRSRRDETADR
jgi:hypothetical protein